MLRTSFDNLALSAALLVFCCSIQSWGQAASSATRPHPAPRLKTHAQGHPSSVSTADSSAMSAPLPDAATIKQRLIENLKAMQAEQERYLCRVTRHREETDKNGKIKKSPLKTYDMFYVHGQEIDQMIAKDGRPLDASQQKKESERVQKEIADDSDEKHLAKAQAENNKQLDTLLHALRFTNGHRQMLNGRTTLGYDLMGDPSFHPKNVPETFLHNMTGTVQMDEATSQLIDLNAHLDHDVKIGGGLLANVHKGLWLHVHQVRQPDGVWINDLAEGKGDARAALFLHPYFQFQQTTSDCHLTNVTTQTSESHIADSVNKEKKTP